MDESGDTGFQFHRNSSQYFVVTVVLFDSEAEAEKVGRRIDGLKSEIGRPMMEFHFAKTDNRSREKFFSAIRGYDFTVFAAVCDKSKLHLQDKHEDFLLAAFGTALEGARDAGILQAVNLKYDEAGGNALQKKLASALLAKINGGRPGRFVARCKPQGSKGNNLIQLADMICGAIAGPYNKPQKEHDYLETIKHRVHSVLQWP